MDDIQDMYTIDVELDEDFKKVQTPRCKDAFLNILCEDNTLDDEDWADNDSQSLEESERESGEEYDREEYDRDAEEGALVGLKYSIHNPKVKWNRMKPICGERYESPHQLKLCLTNYAVSNGYKIRFKKCDSVRLVAVCASSPDKNCPYVVRASWMSTERTFQIKKMTDQHKCVRNYNTAALMNPTWIARQFLKELIRKPNLKCKEMQTIIQSRFHCKVSWSKCYRARCRAMSLIEGKLSDHYARVWDYAEELVRSNPGSTVRVGVTTNPDNTTTFQRIYICFKAIKDGWNKGCRRVIGFDGSFLKGQCKGELLTAIGRDANNHIYPIAWAVVDIENKNNWKWFMELVDSDLGLDDGRGLCIISDQHKGLLEAAKEILPHVEHRQCARHIYANFRKVFSGEEFKNMFWAAAKSTVEGDFVMNMEKIKDANQRAYDHLMAREPATWCRAFFQTGIACEAVENGVAECFNAVIVDARMRPLLTMLEEIRLYLMERNHNLKCIADKWDSNVCPTAVTKMEQEFGDDLKSWNVVPSGLGAYEARDGFQSYGVDLEGQYCTCRLWELSGIPCVHAQACILFTGQDPARFISGWFSKRNYMATYEYNIKPVNGSNLWVHTPYIKPLPPIPRRMPGRPSIKRKRHVSEHQDKYSQVSNKGRTVQCTNCHQKGHNKTSCKNPQVIAALKPKKKMGRPRLDPDLNHWTGRRGGGPGSRGGGTGKRGGGTRGRGSGTRGGRGGRGGRGKRGGGTANMSGVGPSWTGDTGVMNEDVANNLFPTKVEHFGDDEEHVEEQYTDSQYGMDYADKHGIRETIEDLRASNYTDSQIMDSLGITEEELIASLGHKESAVEIDVSLDPCGETQDATQPNSQDSQPIPETQEVQEQMFGKEEGNEVSQMLKRRRPSERILKMKLKKKVDDKDGKGMTQEKAIKLD